MCLRSPAGTASATTAPTTWPSWQDAPQKQPPGNAPPANPEAPAPPNPNDTGEPAKHCREPDWSAPHQSQTPSPTPAPPAPPPAALPDTPPNPTRPCLPRHKPPARPPSPASPAANPPLETAPGTDC